MKLVLAFVMTMASLSAFAGFSEVECDGRNGQQNIRLVIDGTFNSYWKTVRLQVKESTTTSNYSYNASSRGVDNGFKQVRYDGAGFQLAVDLWPDPVPRWSGFYRATLRAREVGTGFVNLNCRFPNAH